MVFLKGQLFLKKPHGFRCHLIEQKARQICQKAALLMNSVRSAYYQTKFNNLSL